MIVSGAFCHLFVVIVDFFPLIPGAYWGPDMLFTDGVGGVSVLLLAIGFFFS